MRTSAQQLVGAEPAAQRDGHEVLREDVERPLDRAARLDPRGLQRRRGRPHLHQLERVGRHAGDAARRRRAGGRCGRRAASAGRRPSGSRPGGRGRPGRSPRRGRGWTCRRRSAACRRAGRPRPSRASCGRASRGAARSCRPSRGGRRAAPGYQISACERVLVNTSALSPSSIAATTCGSSREAEVPGPREALDRLAGSGNRRRSPSGPHREHRPGRGRPSPSSRAARRAPHRGCRAWPTGPSVRRPGRKRRSRASASSVCTPRLVPISSCHSSTTTSRGGRKSWRHRRG